MLYQPKLAATAAEKDETDILAWQRTHAGFSKDQMLTDLHQDFAGVIGQAANQYRAAPLPFVTLELEAKRIATQAFKDYKPNTGMKPSSFVGTRVRQRLNRYVAEHQNVARIPEAHVHRIGAYNQAIDDLSSRHGREPSTHEVADHMGIPVRQVTRLRTMLRAEVSTASDMAASIQDFKHDPDYERTMLGYYSLTEQEKAVFDMLVGAHGQKQLKATAIARKMGVSPARISALKKSIAKKLSPYLQG